MTILTRFIFCDQLLRPQWSLLKRLTTPGHVDSEDKDAVAFRDAIGREQKSVVINELGYFSNLHPKGIFRCLFTLF